MADDPSYDPHNPETWPEATIVVRGGEGGADRLQAVFEADAELSVQSDPAASFRDLCRCLPYGKVRRTTLTALRAVGGRLIESHGPDNYHCDVVDIDGITFDSILSAPEDNPVPKSDRLGGR